MQKITKLKCAFAFVMILLGICVTSESLLVPTVIKSTLAHPQTNPFIEYDGSPLDLSTTTLDDQASQVKSVLDGVGALILLFLSPLVGGLSDIHGRKPMLMIAMFFFVADYILLSVSYWQSWIWYMLMAKAASSVGMTHIPVCAAYMSDLYDPSERARAYGIVAASFGVGLAIGPSTIGYFGASNVYVALGAGLSVTVVGFIVSIFLPESLNFGKNLVGESTPATTVNLTQYCNPFRTVGVIISTSNMYLTGLSIVYMIYCTAINDVLATLVLYTGYRYSWTMFQVGLCYSLLGVFICVNQGFLLKGYEKYLGLRKMLSWGLLVSCIAHLVYAFSSYWWIFIVAMVISSFGFVCHPALMALITDSVDPDKRGMALGAMGAVQSVCSLVGGVSYDNLFAYFSSASAPIWFPGAQFALGSFLFGCAWVGTLIVFTRHSAPLGVQVLTEGERKPLLVSINE